LTSVQCLRRLKGLEPTNPCPVSQFCNPSASFSASLTSFSTETASAEAPELIDKRAKKYATALRKQLSGWVKSLGAVDLLVGIPCYNNEDTIAHVVSMAAEGLNKYYGDMKTAILVSDGGSLDDTREEALAATVPKGTRRQVSIYRGVPGKGTSFRAVFETAVLTKAKACVVVDSDLRSITPEWIKCLAGPVMSGKADYITPYYLRHKNDGTITNNIVYPMTRALYGLDVRQPIGGDFGFSGKIAEFYIDEDVWQTDIARFGIDVWMTTSAINQGFRIAQTYLGVKIHDAKDPGIDLGGMFREVISTLFYLMGRYRHNWIKVKKSREVEIFKELENGLEPEPVSVNFEKLDTEFLEGYEQFSPLYDHVLDSENFSLLKEKVSMLRNTGIIDFPAELWAKILYNFGVIYQLWTRNRRRLVSFLTPLYFGRAAAICREMADMTSRDAEKVIVKQAEVFEKTKPYLLKKMEQWQILGL